MSQRTRNKRSDNRCLVATQADKYGEKNAPVGTFICQYPLVGNGSWVPHQKREHNHLTVRISFAQCGCLDGRESVGIPGLQNSQCSDLAKLRIGRRNKLRFILVGE
jgi:hypothetical protein